MKMNKKIKLSFLQITYLLLFILWFILFSIGLGIDWYHIDELKNIGADSPWYVKILETLVNYPKLTFSKAIKLNNNKILINYFTIAAGVLGIVILIMVISKKHFMIEGPDTITEKTTYDYDTGAVTTTISSAHDDLNVWIKIGLILLSALLMFMGLQFIVIFILLLCEIYEWDFNKPQFLKILLLTVAISVSASGTGSVIKLLTTAEYTYHELSGIRSNFESYSGDFSYIDDHYVSINSYNHNARKLVMKTKAHNKFIYTINNKAFTRATKLEEVVLPSNLLILNDAFFNLPNLKKMTLPNTLLMLGYLAIPESIEYVVLPESIFKIETNSLNNKTIFYAAATTKPASWPSNSINGVTIYWQNEWHYDANGRPALNS